MNVPGILATVHLIRENDGRLYLHVHKLHAAGTEEAHDNAPDDLVMDYITALIYQATDIKGDT